MTGSGHSVLLAGIDDALARRVVVMLGKLAPHFHRAPSADRFADQSWAQGCELIIAHYGGDLSVLEREAGLVAKWTGWSRPPAFLVLCSSEHFDEVLPLVGRGVCRVVVLEEIETALLREVSSLLAAAPRFRVRVPVRLDSAAATDIPPNTATTENLSWSGMLVSCAPEYSVGSEIRFALTVPGQREPIRGTARIVRMTDPAREGLDGVGARFESFLGSGRSRLGGLLSARLQ